MSARRLIGVVTVGRSDFGIYRPLLKKIQEDESLDLRLFVGGMHWSETHGLTTREVEREGFRIDEKICVPGWNETDMPLGIARLMGRLAEGFAEAYQRTRPDILVVLGDRYEMHAAALAALPFNIPLAHIHGGELTEGAMDDALRHSITKLSHLHFVATEDYGRRVVQLGEEPWRVTVSGAPSLDNLGELRVLEKPELEKRCGMELSEPPVLVTFHPVTLEYEKTEFYVKELLAALQEVRNPIVLTLPNADTGNTVIVREMEAFVKKTARARLVGNFGTEGYFSMLRLAAAMVGNSSSGIVEAPSFKLPVVNIGTRQRGRVRADNVIDVGCLRQDIASGIRRALTPGFRQSLADLKNPYGSGGASTAIVRRLKEAAIDERLLMKHFHEAGGSLK